MQARGSGTTALACRETECPIEGALGATLDAGRPLPPHATPSIALLDLVPRHCAACPKWDERPTRARASRLHLEALAQAKHPAAVVMRQALGEIVRARGETATPQDALALAIKHLRDAHGALARAEGHRSALAPVFEERLQTVLKRFVRHPEELFALAGWREARGVEPGAWGRYLATLEARLDGEDAQLRREGDDEAVLLARDVAFRLARDAVPARHPHEVPVVLLGAGAGPALPLLVGDVEPVVVRLDPALPGVLAPDALPLWAARLLDPRPDAFLVAEFQRSLRAGDAPELLTEAFISAREHEREWPRGVVREGLSQLANEGVGQLRDVPEVGEVLLLH